MNQLNHATPMAPVGLDDLLGEASDDRRTPRRRPGWWLVRSLLGAAVVAAALVMVLRVVGFELAYPVAATGAFALFCLHRLVTGLPTPPVTAGRRTGPDTEQPEADEFDAAIHRWQTEISWGRAGIRPFTRTSSVLGDLTDERLRLRHGFTLASDPERARTLVGERLWSYLNQPEAPTPSPRNLAALLTDVEKL